MEKLKSAVFFGRCVQIIPLVDERGCSVEHVRHTSGKLSSRAIQRTHPRALGRKFERDMVVGPSWKPLGYDEEKWLTRCDTSPSGKPLMRAFQRTYERPRPLGKSGESTRWTDLDRVRPDVQFHRHFSQRGSQVQLANYPLT